MAHNIDRSSSSLPAFSFGRPPPLDDRNPEVVQKTNEWAQEFYATQVPQPPSGTAVTPPEVRPPAEETTPNWVNFFYDKQKQRRQARQSTSNTNERIENRSTRGNTPMIELQDSAEEQEAIEEEVLFVKEVKKQRPTELAPYAPYKSGENEMPAALDSPEKEGFSSNDGGEVALSAQDPKSERRGKKRKRYIETDISSDEELFTKLAAASSPERSETTTSTTTTTTTSNAPKKSPSANEGEELDVIDLDGSIETIPQEPAQPENSVTDSLNPDQEAQPAQPAIKNKTPFPTDVWNWEECKEKLNDGLRRNVALTIVFILNDMIKNVAYDIDNGDFQGAEEKRKYIISYGAHLSLQQRERLSELTKEIKRH